MKHIVSVQLTKNGPKYLQITEQITRQINEAVLLPGDKLPPIRKFAEQLGVNSATIVKAYETLQNRDLVLKIQGSGVYVGGSGNHDTNTHHDDDLNDDELYLDDEIDLMQHGSIKIGKAAINFATSTPTSDMFPVAPFKKAINEVLDRDGGKVFEYNESNGYLPLRRSICTLLRDSYTIETSVERLQIISGAQQGIDIAAKALLTPGDSVLVEDPTYTGALAVFKSRGARIAGVPMLSDGIDLVYLEKSIQFYRPRVLYVMSDFQNPTTYSYSEEKRKALITLAQKYTFYIIEDDYLSDLSFSNADRPKPLKAYDNPLNQRVIYIKSFSKLLMPGLRIGFLTAPKRICRDILQAKHLTDIASSGLIQRAFDDYLRSGVWKKHIQQMCSRYEKRHTTLAASIRTRMPGSIQESIPEGGFSLWLPLPSDVSAAQVYKAAAKRGILCTPGNVFRAGKRDFDDHIRLSIAAVDETLIDKGIQILSEVIEELQDHTGMEEFISPLM